VGLCGGVWLLDSLLTKKIRLTAVEKYKNAHEKSKSKNEFEAAIAELEQEPLIVEYAKSFFPVLFLVLILRSFLIEPFQIPTGSMIPTLNVGDFIVVNKFAYGVRLPVIGTKIMNVDDPERGEVMVFVPPHENKYYIKRVIGLPGDTIRYEDKNLYINGDLVRKTYLDDVLVKTSIGDLSGSLSTELLGDVSHPTQHIDAARGGRLRTTWVVPNGHYFMMGDNRDNSADSREWGTVSEQSIVGNRLIN
jgi:signal peptidase I